ncbi:GntR family transcriptional regulator [Actinoplanes sp. NBRC 14428]|uniref:GntR family transcriptional regulator n=1 Tax=Pseudosporangium ferrugineum TaxID=439699 RepID=A0A2T0SIA4_9ACTN|nr:GntR family transcriptional regulator [Pseudosporangium ferrugineum]PRY33117.1 GntR family transcriptional regulator [Pseudosporangium ferrugineum]BCJ48900.1 GntR family transcriptional regulator [Actinoplanes sp. NBRC 14428]
MARDLSAPRTPVRPVEVDRSSPVPLYFQVATRLQELIEAGEIGVGARIENEVDLAERLGVSRPTTRRAIQYLVERGMLVRKRGVGTQVVHPKVRRPVELSSLYDDLVSTDREPRTEVLALKVVPAPPEVAGALELSPGTEVTWIERLRHANGEPLALMHNAIPLGLLHLEAPDLAAHGLYELLRRAGYQPRTATQVIGARAAGAAEARVLRERRGASLLTMTRTAWDVSGRALEYGAHVYRASRYSFELNLTAG